MKINNVCVGHNIRGKNRNVSTNRARGRVKESRN